MPKTENVFSTSARAGQLATFLGRDLVSRITGSGSGRERLIINTSENLTEEGKTTYSVEYRLTDRWSLVGEYDRFSELNAAVKWRIDGVWYPHIRDEPSDHRGAPIAYRTSSRTW